MILVDDPAAFPADLLGGLRPDGPDSGTRMLWSVLVSGRPPRVFAGPDRTGPFWRAGFLVAAPDRSQFDLLRKFTAAGEWTGPYWCLAAAGTGCRGQHGRRWQAEPGNLHLSIALDVPAEAIDPGLALNGLAVVSTLDAVGRWLPPDVRPGIKWVNDLWLDGAKVGGVLTAVRRRPDRVEVFLGIGLNVAVAPEVTPDRFTPRTTCLADHLNGAPGLDVVVPAVLDAVRLRWLEYLEHGPGPLVDAYRNSSLATGRQATLWPDGESTGGAPLATGRVAGIAADLGLLWEDRPDASHEGRLELEEP